MPESTPRYYWDACVFLSGIEMVEDRVATIEMMLDNANNGTIEIWTSMLSITEVAFVQMEKTRSALDPSVEANIDQLWAPDSPVKLVEFHELIARRAKALMRQAIERGWSLKPIDAIHLATASSIGAQEFHTYDGKLEKYSTIAGMRITKPYVDALPFPDGLSGGKSDAGGEGGEAEQEEGPGTGPAEDRSGSYGGLAAAADSAAEATVQESEEEVEGVGGETEDEER